MIGVRRAVNYRVGYSVSLVNEVCVYGLRRLGCGRCRLHIERGGDIDEPSSDLNILWSSRDDGSLGDGE